MFEPLEVFDNEFYKNDRQISPDVVIVGALDLLIKQVEATDNSRNMVCK